ncbi:tetratricopeptide repeat protein [Bdellovibrio sp. HCB337]|uniref:tetratricopeptide repeat protein n=1 Tax=Bdellovibrio sp. HCB337 TaxID=3394358 RepID=UPI0039A6CBCF
MQKLFRLHSTNIGLIIFAIILVFGISLTYSFVSLDDYRHLHDNPAMSEFSFENLKSIWSKSYFGMYAPVTYTVWSGQMAFAKWLGGDEIPSAVFHFGSVLLHTLNTILVYFLLQRLGLRKTYAVIAALIFSLHPVQVESVTWVSSFRDLLAAFWGLLFLNGLMHAISSEGHKLLRSLYLGLFLLFALLSKPSAVVFVPLAILCFSTLRIKPQKVESLWLAVWALMAIAVTMIAKTIQPDNSVDLVPVFSDRILLSLHALSVYAQKIFWPVGLTPDYGLSPLFVLNSWQKEGFAYGTFILALLGVTSALWFTYRNKSWAQGLLFALIALVPYSGFIIFNFQNVSTIADRYLYISMIGIAWCISSILASPRWPQKLGVVFGALAIMTLAGISFQQNSIWKNDETLFTHMLQSNPRSFYGYGGLGNLLLVQGKTNEALPLLQKAVELRPTYPQALTNIGRVFELQGKPQEALPKYIQAINIDPNFVGAYISLADLLVRAGRLAEARETVAHGFTIAPNSRELHDIWKDIEAKQQK